MDLKKHFTKLYGKETVDSGRKHREAIEKRMPKFLETMGAHRPKVKQKEYTPKGAALTLSKALKKKMK